jgi:hypothetical protein
MTKTIKHKNEDVYSLKWDEHGMLDTITRTKDGKLMLSTSRVAKIIFKNIDSLQHGSIPDNMLKIGWRWA